MPLRSVPSPLLRRLFHTSSNHRADNIPDHYATLKIPTNATPSEVKKSFYTLSKTHHPDRNPDDPEASTRFVKISEAYNILGTPAKRQQYDRDHLRSSQPHSPSGHHHARPTGSYHSSGPAGGRPASGLSRRRSQFQGPPPSFYRSGGWGQHGAKRHAAQGGSMPGGGAAQGMGGTGGMGPGHQPFGGHTNDVPHFDQEGHFRTHESIHSQQERRRRRRMEDYEPDIGQNRGILANFIFVGSVVSFAVFVPSFLFEKMGRKDRPDR